MLYGRKGRIIGAAAAMVLLGMAGMSRAGISFDGASRISLTHDADVSNAGDVPFSTGLIGVPGSASLFPTNPYQLDHTFTSGTANTLATGSLGRVTNATTASFVLATGTGVTQTDPINAYPGESSLKFDVDLNWNVTAGGFGPLANGFASLNTGVVVGIGGSAELHINLNFVNQNGTALRTPWVVNKTWPEGNWSEPFSTSRVLGAGSLPAGSKLRIFGTIEFLASNAESPSRFDALRAEFGGTPPTGVYETDAQGSWFGRNWQQLVPDPSEPGLLTLPNGIGHRAWFAGTNLLQAHSVNISDNITLGTLDISSPTAYNFIGSGPISWSTQQGEAVLNVRNPTGSHSMQQPFILSSKLDVIAEGQSSLLLSGPISGAQGITKFGAGTLTLAGSNTYSGPTTVNEGTLIVTNDGGSATGNNAVVLGSLATLGGNGHLGGIITARSGAHIAPGNGFGSLTLKGLTSEPGSVLDIEGAGSLFDSLVISGTEAPVFNDTKVNLIEMRPFVPGSYPLIQYNGNAIKDLGGKLSLLNHYYSNTWATLVDNTETTTVMLNISSVPQWNVDANGSWGSAGNWSPAVVPNGPTAVAGFLTKITAPRTVTLDGIRTVGSIIFDNPNRYTLSSGTLLVGDASNPATIEVANGSHVISTQLTFAGSTQVAIAPGQALTLSGTTNIAADQVVAKVGDGTLTFAGKMSTGAGSLLSVTGGTVNLNANPGAGVSAASSPLTLSITGSKVVLGTSIDILDLLVAYQLPGSQTLDLNSPITAGGFRAVRLYSTDLDGTKADQWDAILNANKSGASDPLDGIMDSHLHAGSAVGIAKMSNHVLIRQTRIGDLNLDGTVTISDFIDLASHFNQTGSATWQEGDLNYDRNVTIADFIELASNFNTSYAGDAWAISAADAAMLADFAEAHGVPEPGMVGVILGVIGCLGRYKKRPTRGYKCN